MLPAIGFIVAAYAIARLIQVPIEHSDLKAKWTWLLVISIPAIAVIGFFALDLLVSGLTGPSSRPPF